MYVDYAKKSYTTSLFTLTQLLLLTMFHNDFGKLLSTKMLTTS